MNQNDQYRYSDSPLTDHYISITENDVDEAFGMEPLSGELLDKNNLFIQAYTALNVAFVAVPVIAGLDKFTYFLTDWTQYLAPVFPRLLGVSKTGFMYGIGLWEIALGIGVAFKPRVFAYIFAAYMCAIIVNTLVLGNFFEISLHDFGLALGAFALGKLSDAREENLVAQEQLGGFNPSPVLH